jgi:GNAT superfamily N-acetyltransferase
MYIKNPTESSASMLASQSVLSFTTRPAISDDVSSIYQLLRDIKIFHECDPSTVNLENITKYGFGATPRFKVELALVDNKVVGLALYYFGFSGFRTAPEMCLEDLYIQPEYRGRGIGTQLFQKLRQYAKTEECCRIFWLVESTNQNAFKFYDKMGGKKSELVLYRLPKQDFDKVETDKKIQQTMEMTLSS